MFDGGFGRGEGEVDDAEDGLASRMEISPGVVGVSGGSLEGGKSVEMPSGRTGPGMVYGCSGDGGSASSRLARGKLGWWCHRMSRGLAGWYLFVWAWDEDSLAL